MIRRNVIGSLVFALASGAALAGQSEALEVFTTATCGALTFEGDRMVDDISNSFMHFTKSGRASLIGELSRVGILTRSVSESGALRCAVIPQGVTPLGRTVGENGLDQYEVKADVNLQWSRCASHVCTKLGSPKKAVVKGVVGTFTVNGRPAYKLTSIVFQEGLMK